VLGIGVVTLWYKSYSNWYVLDRRQVWIENGRPTNHHFILDRFSSHAGRLIAERYRGFTNHGYTPHPAEPTWVSSDETDDIPAFDATMWQRWGVILLREKTASLAAGWQGDRFAIGVPHLLVVILLALLPILRVRAFVLGRRCNALGLCPVCNYDLRATPDRCPECGTIPPK